MEELRELFGYVRPDIKWPSLSRDTDLMKDLNLTDCEGLALVALIEARSGRTFGWEIPLYTLGDLEDYLAAQGVEWEGE